MFTLPNIRKSIFIINFILILASKNIFRRNHIFFFLFLYLKSIIIIFHIFRSDFFLNFNISFLNYKTQFKIKKRSYYVNFTTKITCFIFD